jgi:hypothetical protein
MNKRNTVSVPSIHDAGPGFISPLSCETDGTTEPVFFKKPAGLTVGEIAILTGAKLRAGVVKMISLPTLPRSAEQARLT